MPHLAADLPPEIAERLMLFYMPLTEITGAITGCIKPLGPVGMVRTQPALVCCHRVCDG